MVAAQWFQAARDYLPSVAERDLLPPIDINVAIANSVFANMTEAVSEMTAVQSAGQHILANRNLATFGQETTLH